MIDYLSHITAESMAFGAALRRGGLEATVPTCPEWTLADLGFHLAEVQYFWGSIVEGLLLDPEDVEPLERPDADADVSHLFDVQSLRLVTALRQRNQDDRCWTWHETGSTVGWVLRRQAHEAAIHRVDAELTTGTASALDHGLAVDGVDEILTVMIGGYPSWAEFTPDGTSIAIRLTDAERSWHLRGGRMTGTSPRTGNDYDLEAFDVIEGADDDADATISAPAAAMDLWLWGRGTDIAVAGDRTQADRLRALAAEDTQ
ncbi:MAG: maleylpyruvate isomerase family mycothiol-dependent enzyme [Acidimicrobiia bacterium]|nr:maleylpyruvate isomerase family mycothiol-dependent enzyme [Acidimicrobiia bacterium]